MRKALVVLAGLLLLAAAPAWADEHPWAHGDNEFILSFDFGRDDAGDRTVGDFTGAWSNFVTDRVQVGAATSFIRTDSASRGGAGPFFEYNFPNLKRGHLFIGGDLQALTGDLSDQATMVAATRLGYKAHVGNSSAIRISAEFTEPVNENGDADGLKRVGLSIGFSLGVTPETVVN